MILTFEIKKRISPLDLNRASDLETYLKHIGNHLHWQGPILDPWTCEAFLVSTLHLEFCTRLGTGFGDISCLGDGHGGSERPPFFCHERGESVATYCGGGRTLCLEGHFE